jgi:hypothetical protein
MRSYSVGPYAGLVAPAPRPVARRRLGRSLQDPGEVATLVAQIAGVTSIIASGVEGAGYGDKRTDFRSYAELRQILNDLEDELASALGYGWRPRQVRMTTQADKGL